MMETQSKHHKSARGYSALISLAAGLLVMIPAPGWTATGNAWHFPWDPQSGITSMRQPVFMLYSNTPLVLISGNQYQGGGGNPGNQLETGSAVFFRIAGMPNWTEQPMTFHRSGGNNKYYAATLPPGIGQPGDQIEYYFRIPYEAHDTTYIHGNGTSKSVTTANENTARANPFSMTILATPAPAFPSPADWRDVNIYQILTDRYYDGDPGNNHVNPEATFNPHIRMAIHGGDFKGIIMKLDYLKSLGVEAIWISPIHQNRGVDSYHGYGADDWYKVAPHWGSVEELREMVDAAHARGIYVILDIVANHMSRRIDSTDAGWPAFRNPPDGYNMRWQTGETYPPPFDLLQYFHNNGATHNFHGNEEIYGELAALDDLATETEYVRRNLTEIFKYWISVADFDGFRIDTIRHVEIGFWQFFNPEIRAFAASIGKSNFFQFGEAFTGDEGGVGYFTGTKAGGAFAADGMLDYPLYFALKNVFAGNANTKQIEDHYHAIPTWYDPATAYHLPTFIDNHDNDRFLSSNYANNNWDKLRTALSFLYTSRGIPTLYYGTEQAFNGTLGNDNANRRDMFDGEFEAGPSLGDNFNMSHPLFIHVGFLNNLRRNYPSLRRGSHINRWNDPNGAGLFSYMRRLDGEEVFVIVNTAGGTKTLPPRQTDYPAGTILVNLYNTNETITVNAGAEGTPSIDVPGLSAKMFIAANRYKPLDPVVISQTPVHDTHAFPVDSPLQYVFSQAMDTSSVQAAFGVQPPVSGTFSWSANRKTMTFTPEAPGFSGSTTITARIGAGATSSENTNTLYAAFETIFHTSAADLADTDGDGIPDWWTQLYFNHPLSEAGDESLPGDDPDEDGMTNAEERIAGTHPLIADSVFTLSTESDGGIPFILFHSRYNRTYTLEATSDLFDSASWICIQSNIPGTDGSISLTELSTFTTRVFRLMVELE